MSVYLAVHTSKVGQIFVGETEQCQRMKTDTFALCAIRLVKLTPRGNEQDFFFIRQKENLRNYFDFHLKNCLDFISRRISPYISR